MAFLVKKGNEIADRLETAISASRKVRPLANPLANHASVAAAVPLPQAPAPAATRSEEHTSELQSLMRISYAVCCLKKKTVTKRRDSSRRDKYTSIQYNKHFT